MYDAGQHRECGVHALFYVVPGYQFFKKMTHNKAESEAIQCCHQRTKYSITMKCGLQLSPAVITASVFSHGCDWPAVGPFPLAFFP